MKPIFAILAISLSLTAKSQEIDSIWARKYVQQFSSDTGGYLPGMKFIDEQGNKKTLADFKGKILYLDVWSTWCKNCIAKFPYQAQLLKRLKTIGLDSAVQLVNINFDDSKARWKNSLAKYKPVGINLHSNDKELDIKWNLTSFPAYLVLDTSGKVIAKDVSQPDEVLIIDYILYAASQGIKPSEAYLTYFRQYQNYRKYRQYTNNIEGVRYSKWYASLEEHFLAFSKWRSQHQTEKSR